MNITEKNVSKKLRLLGVPANGLGFGYIKTAIKLIAEDESRLYSVSKVLYPLIAKKHNTEALRVERAIRHAVELMFTYGDLEEIAKLGTPNTKKGKMTNGEFLGALYEFLKYEE